MANEKQYIKNVSLKMKEFPNGGQQMNFSFNLEKFIEQCRAVVNEKGYVNLCISSRKEVGQYGDTHSLWVNTWQPKQDVPRSSNPASRYADGQQPEKLQEDSGLPF